MPSAPVAVRYAAHGLCLVVQADSPALMAGLDAVLAPFAVGDDAAGGTPFTLRIKVGRPTDAIVLDPALKPFWAGRLADGGEAATYAREDLRFIDLPDRARLRADLAAGRGHLVVAPGCERATDYGCILPLLVDLFARAGQTAVHAAGVADTDGYAVLLSGISGRGKTTTALALLGAGRQLMADDTCFVGRESPDRPLTVWGLPRAVKVHAGTVALLPWLADMPSSPSAEPDERRIRLADVPSADPRRRFIPKAILLVSERNSRDHTLTVVDRLSAVTALTRENVRAADARAVGPAGRAFGMLTQLVAQCDVYALSVGPNLASLAERLADALG
ncbi:MAG: hypothetical protein GX591_14090 [Planctomycetes bacterium]|nr:hypothetical protein [Planctomycetota bacterium]